MKNLHDIRTFNIADAQAGGEGTPPAVGAALPGEGVGEGGAGASDGGGGTPADAPAFVDWTPEALTSLVPEGFEVTPEQSSDLLKIVNEAKNDPGKIVSGLLNYYTQTTAQAAEQLAAEYNKTQTDWQNEMRTDPTYGGAKFDESLRIAKDVAQRLGGTEFLELLRVTGAGNSVHMLRMLNEAAKLLPKEGTPAGGRPAAQPKSLADKMFGPKT
ncbi:MAG: hypothetical protein HC888_01405 [Candidatus Competibacteraceae bacterium]|nr:hypothetical protein [Candidatus Competibacteraceae bacterium]